ncbi:Uncharacterized protein FKW44_016766, partial [Caligus rogercresseyi]
MEEHDRKTAELAAKATERYDALSKTLPPISVGATVRIQDYVTKPWDCVGRVIAVGRSRDYRIRLPSRRCVWRNRKFLRWIPTKLDPDENSEAAVKDSPRVEDVSKARRSKR